MALPIRAKAAIITLVGAIFGFLLQGPGPIGSQIWPPAKMPVEPTSAQLAGFMAYSVFEALGFGLGIAFLILAYPRVRAAAGSTSLAVPTYLAIGWLLVNWVPHDALHMHVGFNIGGLLAIEWVFHGSLIVCGLIGATFLLRILRDPTPATRPAPAAAASTRVRA